MVNGPGPLLLAIDGNSLLHRAHHAWRHSELRDADGRPTWALRGLISFVARVAARLTPDAVVVGFDSVAESVRKADFVDYKAQRAAKPPELVSQLDDAPDLLRDAGLTVVVVPGFEADDVLASAAALAGGALWRSTLVTSDRDSFALIDDTTSVLRVLNGGIDESPVITPQKLPAVCGVRPRQYRDYAALRGDSSDNLPGAAGIGSKTAAKLLAAFDTLQDVFDALDGGREEQVVEAVGKAATARLGDPRAREQVARNQRLMTMRTDLALPTLASMTLPLNPVRLRAAFAARDIRLASSVWALVGEDPPDWDRERLARPFGVRPVDLRQVDAEQAADGVVALPLDDDAALVPARAPRSRGRGRAAVLPGQLSLF